MKFCYKNLQLYRQNTISPLQNEILDLVDILFHRLSYTETQKYHFRNFLNNVNISSWYSNTSSVPH